MLEEIDSPTVARFRDAIANLPSRKGNRQLSPQTVRKYLAAVQTLLDKAGQPGPRNRDAAGLLTKVPWAKPPRPLLALPRIIDPEVVGRIYRIAAVMVDPQIAGIEPRAWWRALITLCWNTGLRRGTMFALRMEWVGWQARRLLIPPLAMKARRGEVVHLNEMAFEHLLRIRGERELLLPWPTESRNFDRHWHRLQDLAGIPQAEHFGLHAIRKTAATALWESSPEAAQLALGHLKLSTTERYYVSAPGSWPGHWTNCLSRRRSS